MAIFIFIFLLSDEDTPSVVFKGLKKEKKQRLDLENVRITRQLTKIHCRKKGEK